LPGLAIFSGPTWDSLLFLLWCTKGEAVPVDREKLLVVAGLVIILALVAYFIVLLLQESV
jgi:hypothetical protein